LATGEVVFCHPAGGAVVTHGVYSKIKNQSDLCGLTLFGILIALKSRDALPLLGVVIAVQVIRARQETKVVLKARFGDEYREYRQGTCVLANGVLTISNSRRAIQE
jgi:protein-S-isoprenylcysteine O-methyltransferase Ste14